VTLAQGSPWLLAAGIVLPGLFLVDSFAQQAIYPAPRVRVPSPAPAPYEEVALRLGSGATVIGWAWEPAAAPPERPAILFLHGNGENLETMRQVGLLDDLRGLGVPFLALDYPGYGRSGGRASEQGLVESGGAALAWLAARHPERPLIACGWSLGAAVAVALAADPEQRVTGLVALSPWSSLLEVAKHHLPWVAGFLLRERYDSVAVAARIQVPVLVVHGRDDSIIPFRFGARFAAALPPATTRFVPVAGAGHNDLLAQAVVWEELARFLAR
jgi:hypothetical protein